VEEKAVFIVECKKEEEKMHTYSNGIPPINIIWGNS